MVVQRIGKTCTVTTTRNIHEREEICKWHVMEPTAGAMGCPGGYEQACQSDAMGTSSLLRLKRDEGQIARS
jgi:hypothetical protein